MRDLTRILRGAAAMAAAALALASCGGDRGDFDFLRGKRVGVIRGTTFEMYAKRHFKGAEIVNLSTYSEFTQGLQDGVVDFLLEDDYFIDHISHFDPRVYIAADSICATPEAAAVRQADTLLCRQFNDFLAQSRADGTYTEIMRRWLAPASPPMPELPAAPDGSPVLRVGVFASQPPFCDVSPDGTFMGAEPELALRFGAAAGYTIKFHSVAFNDLIPMLIDNHFDMIMATMSILPDRAERILFTDPYYNAVMTLAGYDRGHGRPHAASDSYKECGRRGFAAIMADSAAHCSDAHHQRNMNPLD